MIDGTALLPLRRKSCYGFLSLSSGTEPVNTGRNGKHDNHYNTENDKVPTKFQPLFLQNYREYKERTAVIQISFSSHLYLNVFDVLTLHFDDFSQPHPKN
jgi:hypothetical protein